MHAFRTNEDPALRNHERISGSDTSQQVPTGARRRVDPQRLQEEQFRCRARLSPVARVTVAGELLAEILSWFSVNRSIGAVELAGVTLVVKW